MNNSRKLGLALFALGIIIFFVQRDVFGYFNMIASLFIPPGDDGFYQIILQSYNAIYALSIFLIIAGVVMFYKGRKATENLTPSPAPAEK